MNTPRQPWAIGFREVMTIGLFAWIAYAITRVVLELTSFAGRIAIVTATAYLTAEYLRRMFHL